MTTQNPYSINEKQRHLDQHFLRLAAVVALNMSKDQSIKVGAIVVTPDGRQLSTGYNGFPIGVQENPEKWQRPIKYEYVVHAEINALLNAPFDVKGCTLYTTLKPCTACMGKILNAGIKRVVWQRHPRQDDPTANFWGETWEDLRQYVETCEYPPNDLTNDIIDLYTKHNALRNQPSET